MATPEKKMRTANGRSLAWSYFTRMTKETATCNICHKNYNTKKGNTSTMMRHLRLTHHLKEDSDYDDLEDNNKITFTELPSVIKEPPEGVNEVFTIVIENNAGLPVVVETNRVLPGQTERTLLEGLAQEWENMALSDAFIVCSDGRKIKSHKIVLASLSVMMYSAMLNVPQGEDAVILAPDVDYDTVMTFIRKIYRGGEINLDEVSQIVGTFGFIGEEIKYYKSECDEEEEEVKTEKMETSSAVVVSTPTTTTPSRKKSAIWNYFSESQAPDLNKCNECLKDVSGKKKNTSTMIHHLRRYHKDSYAQFFNNSSSSSISPSSKVTKRTVKNDEERKCPDCMKEFSRRGAMLYHWKSVHSGIKPFTCDQCGASFARIDTFRSHIGSVHSNARPFLCSVCGKTFSRRNVRDMHERVHKGDRRYHCSFCSKKFMTNQQKKNHERTHTGEKPYHCGHCKRQFSLMHQLTTHLRLHTGDRPYRCGFCGETFKYMSSKNKHRCRNMPRIST